MNSKCFEIWHDISVVIIILVKGMHIEILSKNFLSPPLMTNYPLGLIFELHTTFIKNQLLVSGYLRHSSIQVADEVFLTQTLILLT